LETGLPPTDQDKLPDVTRGDNYDEEEEVEDEEPINPPHPPPQRQYRDDQQVHQEFLCPLHWPHWQGMGVHPHRDPNQYHAHDNDDPSAKVKFTISPFYGLYDVEAYCNTQKKEETKLHIWGLLQTITSSAK
jgi:hypothetical protein